MIFEVLAQQVGTFAGEKVMERILRAMSSLIANEHAFQYAVSELREEFSPLAAPSSYEAVVQNFRLSTQDFHEFFRRPNVSEGLDAFLRTRLLARSEGWAFNRPDAIIVDRMVVAFLEAYQRYFLTSDPHLATLAVGETSKQILAIVAELRIAIATLPPDKVVKAERNISEEVRSFLGTLNLPFEVVDQGPRNADIVIVDPTSVFSNRFLLCVRQEVTDLDAIDAVAARVVELRLNTSNTLLVAATSPSFEVAAYAERRRISINTLKEFRDAFLRLSPLERYVVGPMATQALLESLSVHDVFVAPDAVSAVPGERLDFYQTRTPAFDLVEAFMRDPDANMLIILGGYGSGKSAFCARLMERYGERTAFAPAYFALRQLQTSDDIVRIAAKADQLAKGFSPEGSRSLVILDGLDELPNAMNTHERKQNMLRLLQSAARVDKLIVTARTSYFRGVEDLWHLFQRSSDTALWHTMASFIPEGGVRPTVSTIVLRDFSTDQISDYLSEFGTARGLPESFGPRFLENIREHDFSFNYMMLCRSPLYLFLLANSRPWESEDVRCMADVFELFTRYWLERDIAKGRSRWGLSAEDRLEFMEAVAWFMFDNMRHALSFEEFDNLVRIYMGSGVKDSEYNAIALDLQTTGMFNNLGTIIQFVAPGILDYFVVRSFMRGNDAGHRTLRPRRLPTHDQVCLWAGLIESRQQPPYIDFKPAFSDEQVSEFATLSGPVQLDASRIVYPRPPADWRWPFLNSEPVWVAQLPCARATINAVEAQVANDRASSMRLLMMSRRGLHARGSALVCKVFGQWLANNPGVEPQAFTLRQEGNPNCVSIDSIMGLMMLACGPGCAVILEHPADMRAQAIELAEALGCEAHPDDPNLWLWYLEAGKRGENSPDYLSLVHALELNAAWGLGDHV